MTVLVFDLDGTISDPAEGLTAALNHGLQACGEPPRDPGSLERFIGPSLDHIYLELLGDPAPDHIQTAIAAYRDVYYRDGYRKNRLYDGIVDALDRLSGNGFSLYVATAKRQDIAHRVIEHFNLTEHFEDVLGCGLRRKKHELLQEIRAAEPDRRMVMIGDRAGDMEAARLAGAEAVGVLWGYGDEAELIGAGAGKLLGSPSELPVAFDD